MVADTLKSLRDHCFRVSDAYRTTLKDEETANELEAIGSELEKLAQRFDALIKKLEMAETTNS